jgi:hypothetical protein
MPVAVRSRSDSTTSALQPLLTGSDCRYHIKIELREAIPPEALPARSTKENRRCWNCVVPGRFTRATD